MSVLLMRLAAPLQSWGVEAKFNRRGTERIPTKSGIIGLVASALGRRRNESVDDLQALRFGVRIDREGTLIRDFHMAHQEEFWKNRNVKYVHTTTRYYLADAVYVVALEGEETFLRNIEWAIRNPVFPLFLGRRSCPPEGRLSLGIRSQKSLLEALQEEPLQLNSWSRQNASSSIWLYIIYDADNEDSGGYFQRDVPISFDQSHRQYGFRRVCVPVSALVANHNTKHNPMLELMEEV